MEIIAKSFGKRGLSLVAFATALWFCVLPASFAAGAHLRIGMAADVTSIDPHFSNIAPNNAMAWHIYDALANVDADTRLVPGLATAGRELVNSGTDHVFMVIVSVRVESFP